MTARMPSPQCRTVLRHLYQFLAPLISHPWGCCFHITTLLPATGPATACVCVCALGLGAEGDGRNHRPLPSVPPTHDSTIAAHRHIDTSTAIYAQEDGGSGAAGRRRCAERPWFSTKIPQYGRPGYRRSGRPQQRRTPGACRHVGESPQQKKVDSSAAGSSSSEEVAPTASGADAQIVEDPASSNTVDEKLKFALKVRDSMLRDAVDAASRFTVS